MDLKRPDLKRRNRRAKWIKIAVASILLLSIIAILLTYRPSAPTVDKNTVWLGEVKYGTMLREAKGIGRLVPEEVRWVASHASGRVEKIYKLPGALVDEDTIVMELSNPILEQELQNVELQLQSQQADFLSFKVDLQSSLLQLEASVAQILADFHQAQLESNIAKELFQEGLESKLTMKRSELKQSQLKKRHELEAKRYEFSKRSTQARIKAEESRIDQTRARYALLRKQARDLKVRAAFSGVLQKQTVQEGQQVSAGENLAQVVDPFSLKAEIQVSERLAKDIKIGQKATVDMRSVGVSGLVSRIDPNVEDGTVKLDIQLSDELPAQARPDLTVEGIIELDRIKDIKYVQRPVFAGASTELKIFRLDKDSRIAKRELVVFGRASIDTIEVVDGLNIGDKIILSDLQDFSNRDAIELR